MNESNARNQAEAQMRSIREMVAALELDWNRLEELRDQMEAGTLEDCDRDELAELTTTAGDYADRDDAEQRIQEDPLSVEVRRGWGSYDDAGNLRPEEFRILLCTGGPAVQIMGELDDHGEPSRAWIEYQDWGTSWIERVNEEGDQDTLLTYARQFYFGG